AAATVPLGAGPAAAADGGAVDRAYHYLDTVMDAYATGTERRLLQSYNNESGLLTSAFVYDNALALIAYLARPTAANLRRARAVGGVQADGTTVQPWSSTEHNIDCFGLFTLLARYTRDRVWATRAANAHRFVTAMFNPAGGYFWTGTQTPAPDLINKDILPEDVNTWQFLALGEPCFAGAVDWVADNLATGDAKLSGVTFSDAAKRNNPNGVWLEGTAHLAA